MRETAWSKLEEIKMVQLDQFQKYKLEGFIYSVHELYQDSIDSFEKALEIKTDGQIYYQISYCYCYLKDYKKAQEYALKAINEGYDAYILFKDITVGNLAKVNDAVKVLNGGVEKGFASACLALANLHIDNNLEPDMKDPFKASKYLELAFEYAKPEEKAQVVYSVYSNYKVLFGMNPYFSKFAKEDKISKYLKEFNKLGGFPQTPSFFNVSLFDELDKRDDKEVFDLLFKRFDGDAKLIFGLLLLEDEMRDSGKVSADHDSFAFLNILEGVMKDNNGACMLLMALCFGSDLDGAEKDEKIVKSLFADARKSHVCIPSRFRDLVNGLIDHFDEEYSEYVQFFKKRLEK